MAQPLLAARAEEPLLGFRYVLLTGDRVLPPLHRKTRPDGTVELFGDPQAGDAWTTFLVYHSVMADAMSGREFRCPLGGVLAGGRCTCFLQPERARCVVAEFTEGVVR